MKYIKKFEQIKWEWNEEEIQKITPQYLHNSYEFYKIGLTYYLYDIKTHYIYDSYHFSDRTASRYRRPVSLTKLTEAEIKKIQDNNLSISIYNKETDKWRKIKYNRLINKKDLKIK